MKKIILIFAVISCITLHAQTWQTIPIQIPSENSSKIGTLNNRSLQFVTNDTVRAVIDSIGNFSVRENFEIGTEQQHMKMYFIPGNTNNDNTAVMRFSPKFLNVNHNMGDDPPPSLPCVNGAKPSIITAFPQMISVAQNTSASLPTGGNILMGHNGTNAYIETQGTGTVVNNHAGDLFINSQCNRDVQVFGGSIFNSTNNTFGNDPCMSVAGKLSVKKYMQIGNYTSFQYANTALYIYPNVTDIGLKIRHRGGPGLKLVGQSSDTDSALIIHRGAGISDGNVRFSILGNGKTTISTTDANAFEIQDATNSNLVNFKVNTIGETRMGDFSNLFSSFFLAVNSDAGNGIQLQTSNSNAKALSVFNTTLNRTTFEVTANGHMFLGQQFNANTPYMLTVDGKIGAREIRVSLLNPWPDYVFEKNYKLMSLENLEQFLLKNKHLPNIPKATEFLKEECGLNIAEMQGKQMEKIEEIYLHLIELNKQITELKSENEKLRSLINH